MACRPATPAPSTTISAGGTVPAAVMLSGKNRRSRPAATIAHRYPATRACELNASIDWAREIRGTSSIANDVSCRSRSSLIRPNDWAGGRNDSVAAPGLSCRACSLVSAWTDRTRSASASTSATTSAPASAYSSSVYCAATPAPGSTRTS
jgi:hypothetical protein